MKMGDIKGGESSISRSIASRESLLMRYVPTLWCNYFSMHRYWRDTTCLKSRVRVTTCLTKISLSLPFLFIIIVTVTVTIWTLSANMQLEEERKDGFSPSSPMTLNGQKEGRRKKDSSPCSLNAQTEGEMRLLQQVHVLQKQEKWVSVYGGDAERYTYMDDCD